MYAPSPRLQESKQEGPKQPEDSSADDYLEFLRLSSIATTAPDIAGHRVQVRARHQEPLLLAPPEMHRKDHWPQLSV